ncbi:MAG: citrate lyase holo-[acyl-carrier protein] synthase [Acholeplasmataceae bacterium]|nr:citrate lyase holo-[acyl-carrier protein] synthase [Acholeplasmataceae bacterium]
MMDAIPILKAREEKQKRVKDLLKEKETALVVTIKANIPGPNKNIHEATLLVRLFKNELQALFLVHGAFFSEDADGPIYYLALINSDVHHIKQTLIHLEDTHPLGRFIDLDVYADARKSLSRNDLGLLPRACFLCNNDAFICARSGKHPTSELILFIHDKTRHYLHEQIEGIIEKAIMMELNLESKFGLVTPTSCGSHPDMDYVMMVEAKKVIMPYLILIFFKGYEAECVEELLENTRPIGIEAEQAMLEKTGGINCYKGLIFILGLAILASGFALSHQQPFSMLFSNIKTMTKGLMKEFDQIADSFGLKAYQAFQIKGARGEAIRGLPSVVHALDIADHLEDLSAPNLRQLLKEIILISEDTVLLKRAKTLEAYGIIKKALKNIDARNINQARKFSDDAIMKGLSFGGSADLLVTTLFLHFLKKHFF